MRVQGAISCLRGDQLRIGTGLFISEGCVILDEGPVAIGDNVICGPGVKIAAEAGRGVAIEARAWIGENVELRPGVTVGAGAMVCAGSVVESDVPPNAVVEGRPAKVTWYLR
jgi:maltose O-acetyltransferase